MTEQRANEIFRTKYPNGEIRRPNSTSEGSRYWVIFNESHKVYGYRAQSYAELLGRFGFTVVYERDVRSIEKSLADHEKELADGYDNSIAAAFLFEDENQEEAHRWWENTLKQQIAEEKTWLRKAHTEWVISD